MNKIDWCGLSSNTNAIEIANPDNIYLYWLSENPNAIELLKENIDNIDWFILSKNPNAMDILKENPDKIKWIKISINTNIFEPIDPIYKEELYLITHVSLDIYTHMSSI